jgi:DNA polymerase
MWHEDAQEHARLGEYCKRDVEVERRMMSILMTFTEQELADYHLSEHINDNGVCIDIDLAKAVVATTDVEKLETCAALARLTGGKVTTHSQIARILDWVEGRWKRLPGLAKDIVEDALEDSDIPDDVAEVLELRHGNAKAAVSKFNAMLERELDGVIHGLFMFRGAGQTGRYSSVGLQIHNLIRTTASQSAINVFKRRGIEGLRMLGDPVHLLASMVRPTFIPLPGKTFLIGDFAQIEARVTAWLAGATRLLQAFESGRDVYCEFASIAYGRPIVKGVDNFERFVGKGCVLGLGFGGSEAALARTLKQDKVELAIEQRNELVRIYRKEYAPEIPRFWRALQDAVLTATEQSGRGVRVGPVEYLHDGVHLWCRLPSGRFICYPFAVTVQTDYGYSVEYRRGNRAPKSGETKWPVVQLWGGLLTENLAQSIAFDLLMGAIRRVAADAEFKLRLHVHDEIVAEVDAVLAETLLPRFLSYMEELPPWAEGLSVKVEGKASPRYTK